MFIVASTATAASAPSFLVEAVESLWLVEVGFESDAWDKAGASLDDLSTDFRAAIPTLDKSRAEAIKTTQQQFDAMTAAIARKDKEQAEEDFSALQVSLFALMDDYDFAIHPLLYSAKDFLMEALEAIEKGNLEQTGSELREVKRLLRQTRGVLAKRGAPGNEVEAFFQQLDVVERSLAAPQTAEAGVARLIDQFNRLVASKSL
jgi:hypothetical protein